VRFKASKLFFISFALFVNLQTIHAQDEFDINDLELVEPQDAKMIEKAEAPESGELMEGVDDGTSLDQAEAEAMDDLETLKEDIGNISYEDPSEVKEEKKKQADQDKPTISSGEDGSKLMFDVGEEEQKLVEVSKYFQGRIPDKEWNELAQSSTSGSYTVVKDDWLFKISKKLFGSGFYYPKIWSLNPYITNPHEIEPGMVLLFDTGNANQMPEIRVGSFSDGEKNSSGPVAGVAQGGFDTWGFNAKPDWIDEKQKLISQGSYVQYASDATLEDLDKMTEASMIKEYEKYEPPKTNLNTDDLASNYDSSGLDKNSKIQYNFKEGFYLNTFVTTNIVQDFGKVDSSVKEAVFLSTGDKVYVRFDDSMNVIAGDKFSVYSAEGKVSHVNSDREGYKYVITGHVQTVRKVKDVWLCDLTESTGAVQRGDRVTVYTPKIERISKTFNDRNIEAAILSTYSPMQTAVSFGDVVYLDRGRADGVEVGNVFEAYGFKDRATAKNITDIPTYKNGELTIITLTDNFATALVTSSERDFYVGDIAITKSKSAALLASKGRERVLRSESAKLEKSALDELDVELNLDDLNDSLLNKADQIQFTEDELAELERQEREKSVIKEGERDVRALERLEKEIEGAEQMLNEARLDEDKLLETSSLDKLEKESAFEQEESLEDIEENFGKRFMDEDLVKKDNPYGLTPFDVEEIDELLNVEQTQTK
jgi:hypothetical protein